MTSLSGRAAPVALAAALTLTACGGDDASRGGGAVTGAAVGAAVGTAAGAVIGDSTQGTLLGTAAGAAVGGALGWLFGREEEELKQVLAPQREAETAAVERVGEDTLRVTIDEAEAFEEGSASIREAFLPTLDRIAGVLEKYPQSRITVLDFSGRTEAAGRLAMERAEAVRGALATYGIDPDRLQAEGRVVRSAAEAQDRRLEILIAPVA